MFKLLGTLVLLAMAGYLAVALLLFFTQSRLIHLPGVPGRALTATPAALDLDFDEVELTTDDGLKLHGWWLPVADARGTLLFCHGNAGNISHRLESLAIFHNLGLNVLIFDYRGYGRSQGSPGEDGLYRDAQAAWDYLLAVRGLEPGRIVIFGRSLGAAVAAHLASRQKPGALILESAFTSAPDMAADLYPWLPARWLTRLRYATLAYLGSVAAPVLVIHSPHDEIVPFKHGQRLYQAAREPKGFVELRGDHNNGFLVSGPAYREKLAAFLDRHLR